MMELEIEDYRITSDKRNIILSERKIVDDADSDNHGKEYWSTVGYYKNLEHALKALLDKEIAESDAEDLVEVIEVIEDTKVEIKTALSRKE